MLRPRTLQLRFSNSGFRPAMYPSSVVHTGVKSLGCENRIAQPFPIQSWKLRLPSVVSAVKLGASALILSDMTIASSLEIFIVHPVHRRSAAWLLIDRSSLYQLIGA